MTVEQSSELPLLSVILPVFNEQALLEDHLGQVVDYLQSIEDEFSWEVVIVNDGSIDSNNK